MVASFVVVIVVVAVVDVVLFVVVFFVVVVGVLLDGIVVVVVFTAVVVVAVVLVVIVHCCRCRCCLRPRSFRRRYSSVDVPIAGSLSGGCCVRRALRGWSEACPGVGAHTNSSREPSACMGTPPIEGGG